MTDLRITLKEWLVEGLDHVDEDFLLRGAQLLAEGLMELEVSELAGAQRYERTGERRDYRNGTRARRWDTRVGTIELQVPKLRRGGYQPSFLEPRSRSWRALFAVVEEAYVQGVSTRRIEELCAAMGIASMDKSRVSRMCAELDELVADWRCRKLQMACPYVYLDAKYVKVRSGGTTVSKALVVAYGVREDGFRSILGMDLFELESTATWRSFLRGLVERGLNGVQLVISDNHLGLKAAVAEVLTGANWQRCSVHFQRCFSGHVKKSGAGAMRTLVRRFLTQETKAEAVERLRAAAAALDERRPRLAALLLDAEEELLAHTVFPPDRLTIPSPSRLCRKSGCRSAIAHQCRRSADPLGAKKSREQARARATTAPPR